MANLKADFQDVMLEAQAEVTEFMRDFAAEMVQADIIQGLHHFWSTLSDEMKEQFKRENPQAYAELKKQLAHTKGAYDGTD